MARSTHWTDSLDLGDIARQVSTLRREIGALTRSATSHGAQAAQELGDELWHQGEVVARRVGRTARKAGRAVKDDPVPTVVALAGLALLLRLVLSRKRS